MLKRLAIFIVGMMAVLATPLAAYAKTYYWISHGSPADPVWTYFLAGAKQWAKDTGQTVNTSFHYRRQGGRDRRHQSRSRQHGRCRKGSPRREHPDYQLQYP
jgi:hypothetical protein